MPVEFVKNDKVYGLYTPKDQEGYHSEEWRAPNTNYELVTKNEFCRANFSTRLDEKAYMPVLGIGVAAFQLIYGIFELLGGILTLNSERTLEGLRNIVRGGVQTVPILGFWIMDIYDYCTGYDNKIKWFLSTSKREYTFKPEPSPQSTSLEEEKEVIQNY